MNHNAGLVAFQTICKTTFIPTYKQNFSDPVHSNFIIWKLYSRWQAKLILIIQQLK